MERLYEAIKTMLASEPVPPPDPRLAEFVQRMPFGSVSLRPPE